MKTQYDEFAEAATKIDAIAETKGMDVALLAAGVAPEDAKKFALQRGLRVALLMTDPERLKSLMSGHRRVHVALDLKQEQIQQICALAYIDALAVATSAKTEQATALRDEINRLVEEHGEPVEGDGT